MGHTDSRLLELAVELDERIRRELAIHDRGLRLPFNGTLSADEQRMLEQFAFMEAA